jgi:preprotein translocase subunit YajC
MRLKNLIRSARVVFAAAVMCVLFSGCAPASDTSGSTNTAGSTASMLVMMVVMIVAFYFLLIRPERKRKKKLDEMRKSMSVGDKITTIGGMVGKIVEVKDDLITFETGEDRVRIQITKWGVSSTENFDPNNDQKRQ